MNTTYIIRRDHVDLPLLSMLMFLLNNVVYDVTDFDDDNRG